MKQIKIVWREVKDDQFPLKPQTERLWTLKSYSRNGIQHQKCCRYEGWKSKGVGTWCFSQNFWQWAFALVKQFWRVHSFCVLLPLYFRILKQIPRGLFYTPVETLSPVCIYECRAETCQCSKRRIIFYFLFSIFIGKFKIKFWVLSARQN